MNLEDTIKFLKETNVGDRLNIRYNSFFGRERNVEGMVRAINPYGVTLTKQTHLYHHTFFSGDKQIYFPDIINYQITKWK